MFNKFILIILLILPLISTLIIFFFKNDKLIQQKIAGVSSIIDEKEFNEFCKQQLNK